VQVFTAAARWYHAALTSFITSARATGRVLRGWEFDSVPFQTMPVANHRATNPPYESGRQNGDTRRCDRVTMVCRGPQPVRPRRATFFTVQRHS
jgi:hypothetical protein